MDYADFNFFGSGLSGLGYADASGTAALFNFPRGITTDGVNLYVADSGNFKIRKIVIATGAVTTVAGSVNGFAEGIGTAAKFSPLAGITTDGSNLYVADMINQRIRKIVIATGEVTTLAGSGTVGAVNGIGAAASFVDPKGITTDGSYLYVAEYGGHKVRKIVISTGDVSTVAGSGMVPYFTAARDGTGTAADIPYPGGITTNGTNLYVLETLDARVARIQ